jgi:hypothetical protein
MGKGKPYGYLLDGLTPERGEVMKKALRAIPEIKSITIRAGEGIVQVMATRDPENQIKLACDVAGCIFRLKLGKGQL